jgi:Thermostable hemolysin
MFVVVPRSDRLRPAVEDAIQRLYWKRYDALLCSFAQIIVAELSTTGTVECAAGIRFGDEAFLSECYLDLPVEQVLQAHIGRAVRRDQIVEICHLAGAGSNRSLPFVRDLIEFLRAMDTGWAIFTATKPLRNLLQRNQLAMIELGCAERSRVPHPASWGHYFEHDPRVMAISRAAFAPKRFHMPPTAPQLSADARIF